jgi:prepilin-type N-terminal cleavage/methylation domain-containing protein
MKKNNNGFSLVELIIVIAIMAVLVGVLAPQFIKYVEQSRRSRDIATAQEVREAVLADIADGVITGGTTRTAQKGTPSSLGDTPTASATIAKGQSFNATYDVTAGTCTVVVGSRTEILTTEAGASAYKAATS